MPDEPLEEPLGKQRYVRLPENLDERVLAVAKKEDRSASFVIRRAVERDIDRSEMEAGIRPHNPTLNEPGSGSPPPAHPPADDKTKSGKYPRPRPRRH
jgi:hypothetical protein